MSQLTDRGVVARNEARLLGDQLRMAHKKIVFTNGCFDILHRGHVEYLNAARALGDVLIVGCNADASVKRLKGPDRPVTRESDRAFLLSSLRAVDYVIIFSEDTPLELITALKPDVLVKGGDWPIEKIIGGDVVRANGGEVRTIPFVATYSTSSILDRIRSL